ncbi:GNAT family N-acetyltransferase [Bacillus gobiensis]|uniref:GNAT family N-acetyltransferase n=1 Tax=Bacillus gobiensis TaxID=1441095 RepID=UPI003D237BD0
MSWKLKAFYELTATELYRIMKARIDVFVVEQECPYHDADNRDFESYHLFLEEENEIAAYCRLIPNGVVYDEATIGRVLVKKDKRGKGYASRLFAKAVQVLEEEWKEPAIKIQAQVYLREFYGSFGFEEVTEVYLEDNIPHIDMIRTTTSL